LFVVACKLPQKTTAKHDKTNASRKSTFTDNEWNKLNGMFMDASKEKILGNLDKAADDYSQCLKIDPLNAASLYELAQINDHEGKTDEALACIRKSVKIDSKNEWYRMMLAEILLRKNMFAEATGVYEQLAKDYPHKLEYYDAWASVLVQNGKLENAIEVYDKMESMMGIQEDVSVRKEKIYLRMNKLEKAIEEILKLIKEFPKEPRYQAMLADVYAANNLPEKAFETYKHLLEIDPSNPYVHLSLSNYYRNKKENEKSFEELKLAFANPSLDIDIKITTLMSYYMVTEKYPELKDQAYSLLKILTDTHQKDPKAFAITGDFYLRDGKTKEARDSYRKATALDKNKFLIWSFLLDCDLKLSDYESLQKESDEALELFPTQTVLYLFNGIAKSEQKKYKEAIDAFNDGIALSTTDTLLLSQLYSSLGDTYYKDNKIPESDSAYYKALEINPNNATVLNNLSYYLSLRKVNLEKAQEMSKKSNELEPNNPSFQDTYGWIMFQLGKYEDAKTWVEKALSGSGDSNGVLFEHYGDILFKLGEHEKAIENWNKAQKAGGASDLLEKKLREKSYFE